VTQLQQRESITMTQPNKNVTMARDEAYWRAERKIEEALLSGVKELSIRGMGLTELPESLSQLTQLRQLNLSINPLIVLPEMLGQLTQLQSLILFSDKLIALPDWLSQLTQLQTLDLSHNQLKVLPESLGQLTQLQSLDLAYNQLTTLPASIGQLEHLNYLRLGDNPLGPEIATAHEEGLEALKRYLRAKAEAQIILNEAKLILIGEGEVGKSCLLGALRGDPWEEGRPTTHGIEIKPVNVTVPGIGMDITLNGWDFGGQRVYRPTHQLFFSAPAIYLTSVRRKS
jgi:hypothetical protein